MESPHGWRPQVPVTESTLMQRINRRLRDDDQVLKSSNGARAISDLGHYYVVDFRRGRIARSRIELEAFARELGALAEYECLEVEAS